MFFARKLAGMKLSRRLPLIVCGLVLSAVLVTAATAIIVADQHIANSALPADEAKAAILDMEVSILGVTAVVIVVSAIIGSMTARSVVTPLALMGATVEKLALGDAEDAISGVDRTDEIGDLARSLDGIRRSGQRSKRVENALDSADVNMMIADADNVIVYINDQFMQLLRESEANIRKDFPHFTANELIGQSIDVFHKKPEHQQRMLAALTAPHTADLTLGGLNFSLILTPVKNAAGERLGTVAQWNDMTAQRAIEEEINSVVSAAARGDFERRLTLDGKKGFMRGLADGVNEVIEATAAGIGEVNHVAAGLAAGDLTRRMGSSYEGSFAELARNINKTGESLAELIAQIGDSAESVSVATSEILQGANDLAQRTEDQAATVEKTSVAMEELSTTVNQNAESAKQANTLTEKASASADEGAEVMNDAVAAMEAIESSAAKISEIVVMIDEIAFQTNLLALNAAVEAARAGEAGKGFAVVATEVRTLAQRSSEASKEIKDLINSSSAQIGEGVQLVNKTGTTLSEIVEQVKEVSTLISEIAKASSEQAEGLAGVSAAVAKQDETSQQNAALVEETTAAVQSLESQSRELSGLVSVFNIGGARSMGVSAAASAAPIAAPAPKATPAFRATPRPATAADAFSAAPNPVAASISKAEAALAAPIDDDDGWDEF